MNRIVSYIVGLFTFSVPELLKGLVSLWDVLLGWLITVMVLSKFGMTFKTAAVAAFIAVLLSVRAKQCIPKRNGKMITPLPTSIAIRLMAIFIVIAMAVMLFVDSVVKLG